MNNYIKDKLIKLIDSYYPKQLSIEEFIKQKISFYNCEIPWPCITCMGTGKIDNNDLKFTRDICYTCKGKCTTPEMEEIIKSKYELYTKKCKEIEIERNKEYSVLRKVIIEDLSEKDVYTLQRLLNRF